MHYNDSERSIGGKISEDGHRRELSVLDTREIYRAAKRTLRLGLIVQGDDNLREHTATPLHRNETLPRVAITCFW